MPKGGFWDNPFGGLLDFNGDGKEDLAEQFFGYKMFEECTSNNDSYDEFDDENDFGIDEDDPDEL